MDDFANNALVRNGPSLNHLVVDLVNLADSLPCTLQGQVFIPLLSGLRRLALLRLAHPAMVQDAHGAHHPLESVGVARGAEGDDLLTGMASGLAWAQARRRTRLLSFLSRK